MILSDTGNVSLEALRWLADVGIRLVQLDRDGRVLLSTPPGPDDARLRRAQALARDSETGLTVARELLALKVGKQAAVLADVIDQPQLGAAVRSLRDRILQAESIRDCVDSESHAASAYFGGWTGRIGIRFAARDADRVPDHWHEFATRSSIGDRGRSPRVAVTPVNALLNYLYALAEAECRSALTTLGLDPGLGVWHRQRRRDHRRTPGPRRRSDQHPKPPSKNAQPRFPFVNGNSSIGMPRVRCHLKWITTATSILAWPRCHFPGSPPPPACPSPHAVVSAPATFDPTSGTGPP